MSFKLTLALLAILAVVGVAVYAMEIKPQKPPEVPRNMILLLPPEAVQSIQVSYQGKVTEVKKQAETQWKLTQPQEGEADSARVDGLTYRLAPLSASRVLTGSITSLSPYGLKEPPLRVTLGIIGDETATLLVGDTTPDGRGYYLKRGDVDTVYVVPTALISDVIKLVTDPPKAVPPVTTTPETIEGATPLPMLTPVPAATPAGTAVPKP
ncbi:MAG: DUF4340 domain-containing protein [Chloroflexi bacterium]|nr:DUF4340 domain-containing protein [Chloroflexota bacterium]